MIRLHPDAVLLLVAPNLGKIKWSWELRDANNVLIASGVSEDQEHTMQCGLTARYVLMTTGKIE